MIGPFNMEYFDKDDKFSTIDSEEGYTGRCNTIENLCIVAREKSEETIKESSGQLVHSLIILWTPFFNNLHSFSMVR